jgi:hypothetical protein
MQDYLIWILSIEPCHKLAHVFTAEPTKLSSTL